MLAGIARHSETEALVALEVDDVDGVLRARPAHDGETEPFLDAGADPEVAGVYDHFKGGVYTVVCRAIDPDGDELWAYLTADGRPWVRPAAMFLEHVERDGYAGPRFVKRPRQDSNLQPDG